MPGASDPHRNATIRNRMGAAETPLTYDGREGGSSPLPPGRSRRYVRQTYARRGEIENTDRLRVQVVIATLRRVLVMVISIGGFVEGGR
jgi:hypothetical protein